MSLVKISHAYLIFSALIFVSALGHQISIDSTNSVKIIGGQNAVKSDWKFLVYTHTDISFGGNCGGVIANADWVLTSAWCAKRFNAGTTITAGEYNLGVTEGTEQTRSINQTIIHPEYYEDEITGISRNNIAVVRLSTPFVLNAYVQPALLAVAGEQITDHVNIAGWDGASILQSKTVGHVNNLDCQASHGIAIEENMMCTDYAIWTGDHGGPVICPNVRDVVCGIISVGWASAGLPDVHSRVSDYRTWIDLQVWLSD